MVFYHCIMCSVFFFSHFLVITSSSLYIEFVTKKNTVLRSIYTTFTGSPTLVCGRNIGLQLMCDRCIVKSWRCECISKYYLNTLNCFKTLSKLSSVYKYDILFPKEEISGFVWLGQNIKISVEMDTWRKMTTAFWGISKNNNCLSYDCVKCQLIKEPCTH